MKSAVLPFPVRATAAPDRGRLLTPAEVAERLDVRDRQGRPNVRWVVRHVAPRVQLSARVIRFWEADVTQYLERRRMAS